MTPRFLLAAFLAAFFTLCASAQTLPSAMRISDDGRMLITGDQASTGLYDSATIRTVYLTFPQANYWTLLTQNYTSQTDIPAQMEVDGVTYDSVGVRFKGQTSYMGASASQKKSFNISTHFVHEDQKIMGYKDDQGEPMNEAARSFVVMVPTTFMSATAAALNNPIITTGSTSFTNTLVNLGGFSYQIAINPRLTWTTKFALFRADGGVSPFIRQEEESLQISALAEGSEEEFKNDRHLYGIKAMRNVGFGYWQKACLVTFT